jgi:DtxR family Mn-dependent transcriptional regulator
MTISEQDYLKTIYELGGVNQLVSNKAIADALDLSPPSVSEMVKRLVARHLIEYEPYRGIRLTEIGHRIAIQVIRRHQLWELWLTKELSYPLHMVHDEAERLEHVMSDELENRLFEYLGSPTRGAMGEPIPKMGDSTAQVESYSLNKCETGIYYQIRRIEDDNELIKYFESLGLKLGDELLIKEHAPFEGPVTVIKNEETLIIGFKAASKIHMTLPKANDR